MDWKNFSPFLVLGFVLGFGGCYFYLSHTPVTSGEYANLERGLSSLEEDKDFYLNISTFANLLDPKDYSYYNEIINDSSESGFQNKMEDQIVLFFVNELLKDEKIKEPILALKDKVTKAKQEQENRVGDLFSKNTACGGLTSSITFSLEKDEKLEFVFYSPTKNTCIFATQYTYSNTLSDYYTYTEKRLYDGSSHSKLEEYTVNYYNYPYLSKDEQDSQSKKAKSDYVRFVLENSGYKAELLKDISYLF